MLSKTRLAMRKDTPDCEKCGCTGIAFYPDGRHELDPCSYVLREVHKNVDVHVLQCQKCGHYEVEWFRNEDTEDVFDDCII